MKNFKPFTLIFVAAILFNSCNNNESTPVESPSSIELNSKHSHKECSFIDQYWGQNAYIGSTIVNQSETNF